MLPSTWMILLCGYSNKWFHSVNLDRSERKIILRNTYWLSFPTFGSMMKDLIFWNSSGFPYFLHTFLTSSFLRYCSNAQVWFPSRLSSFRSLSNLVNLCWRACTSISAIQVLFIRMFPSKRRLTKVMIGIAIGAWDFIIPRLQDCDSKVFLSLSISTFLRYYSKDNVSR